MSVRAHGEPVQTNIMGDPLNLESFQRMAPLARLEAIQTSFGGDCGGSSWKETAACYSKAKPIARVLSALPGPVEAGILAELTATQRLTLFRLTVTGKNPVQIAEILLAMPADQAVSALSQLPLSKRQPVLEEIEKRKEINFLSQWAHFISIPAVAARLKSLDDSETLRAMKNGDLMKRFLQSSGRDLAAQLELTRRSDLADTSPLPQQREAYRDLAIESYVNRRHWTLTGFFLDPATNRWIPFCYKVRPEKICRQLWVNTNDMAFPSSKQHIFFSEKAFKWALSGSKKPEKPVWPETMGALEFERIDLPFYPKKFIPDPQTPLTAENMQQGRFRTIETQAEKPVWTYYLSGKEGRLVSLVWDENKDTIHIEVFLGMGLPKDEAWSGPIDDAKARTLLIFLKKIRPENAKDQRNLRRLLSKLKSITRFS